MSVTSRLRLQVSEDPSRLHFPKRCFLQLVCHGSPLGVKSAKKRVNSFAIREAFGLGQLSDRIFVAVGREPVQRRWPDGPGGPFRVHLQRPNEGTGATDKVASECFKRKVFQVFQKTDAATIACAHIGWIRCNGQSQEQGKASMRARHSKQQFEPSTNSAHVIIGVQSG